MSIATGIPLLPDVIAAVAALHALRCNCDDCRALKPYDTMTVLWRQNPGWSRYRLFEHVDCALAANGNERTASVDHAQKELARIARTHAKLILGVEPSLTSVEKALAEIVDAIDEDKRS